MKKIKITEAQTNKIKIIVCDLDGTLFDYKKKISVDTINYLIKLQQDSYILVLATGRFFYELKEYIDLLQMKNYHGYVICCNGVEIHDLANDTTKYFNHLNDDDISILTGLAFKQQLNIRTNYENKYQMILNPWAYFLSPVIKLFTRRYPDLIFYHPSSQIPWSNLGKLCLISTPNKLKKFVQSAKLQYPDHYHYYYTSHFCVELVKNGINKYYAVDYICTQHNYKLDNVLAFGDSGNDELLLKRAGVGIVMKNGLKYLRQEATYISSKTNNHEGVLVMLKQIFKNNID